MSLGPAGRAGRFAPPPNEVEVEIGIPVAQVRKVTLRSFAFQLAPMQGQAGRTDGLKLTLTAAEIGLEVSALFDRAEFVNIATTGIAMLDAADAAEPTEGGE